MPVSTMDRIKFVILLFVNLLHMCFLLGEINCQQTRFRMGVIDSAEAKKCARTKYVMLAAIKQSAIALPANHT
jgi:hypothetical protein